MDAKEMKWGHWEKKEDGEEAAPWVPAQGGRRERRRILPPHLPSA